MTFFLWFCAMQKKNQQDYGLLLYAVRCMSITLYVTIIEIYFWCGTFSITRSFFLFVQETFFRAQEKRKLLFLTMIKWLLVSLSFW